MKKALMAHYHAVSPSSSEFMILFYQIFSNLSIDLHRKEWIYD